MTIAITIDAATYGSYDDLLAALPEYLDGTIDTAQFPGWIDLVEAEINRRLSANPVRPQLTRTTLSLDAEYIDLPDDFSSEVAIDFLDGDRRKTVVFVDWAGQADDAAQIPSSWLFETTTDYTGAPEVASVIDGELRLFPVPDETYSATLLYYAKLAGISTASQTNWFVTQHSDIYLYGLLFHANAFLPDPETAAKWFALFDSRLDQVLRAYPRTVSRRRLRGDMAGLICA